jgi:hypothetical protein
VSEVPIHELNPETFMLAVNIVLTMLIVVRLWCMSRHVKAALGEDHARAYTSLAAIMVESAGPYAICGLIFIVTFAVNSPGQNLFLPPLGQVMCLSPELIIWRMAGGRAWSMHTTDLTIGQPPLRHAGNLEGMNSDGYHYTSKEAQTCVETDGGRKEFLHASVEDKV